MSAPQEFECIKGQSEPDTVAYVGFTAAGRVDGREFVLVAPDWAALREFWSRLVPDRPLGNPVYRAAIIPAQKFNGEQVEPPLGSMSLAVESDAPKMANDR